MERPAHLELQPTQFASTVVVCNEAARERFVEMYLAVIDLKRRGWGLRELLGQGDRGSRAFAVAESERWPAPACLRGRADSGQSPSSRT